METEIVFAKVTTGDLKGATLLGVIDNEDKALKVYGCVAEDKEKFMRYMQNEIYKGTGERLGLSEVESVLDTIDMTYKVSEGGYEIVKEA